MTKGKNAIYGRLLCGVVAVLMALMLFPVRPTTAADGDVAQIGDTTYATLDDAIAAASDGATIELLADATTDGLSVYANKLTICAAEGLSNKPTIIFVKNGIAMGYGNQSKTYPEVVFKDVNVKMNGIGSTPATGEWNWMTICAGGNAKITLDNTTMTMDGTGVSKSNTQAVYFCGNNELNILNGSVLTIKNYPHNALSWDGGPKYITNIVNSTFISDHNRSAFTGTFDVNITNSNVQVINNTGNGSNGSHFYISNSTVNFEKNGSHGLSAGNLSIINGSIVTCNDNGMYGVTYNSNFEMDGTSKLYVYRNALNKSGGGLRAASSVGTSHVAKGAIVEICNNGHNGLENYGQFTFEDGAVVTITGNDERTTNGGGIFNDSAGSLTLSSNTIITNNHAKQTGGGICNAGTVTIPVGVQLYNNHSDVAGDDLYNRQSATTYLIPVENDWILDDCEERIDGWYDDSEGMRWNAHASNPDDNHIDFYPNDEDDETYTVSGVKALKAAHDLTPDVVTGVDKTSNGANSIGQINAGSVVPFEVTLSVPTVGGSLQVSDQMLNMTFNNDLTLNGQSVSYTAQDSSFTLTIPEGYRGQTITLRYTGTVIQDVKDGDSVSNTVYFDSKYDTVTGTVSVQASKPDDYSLTIRKLWENDDATVRPDSITVDIYNDGELVDSVELYEKYGWRYNYPIEEYEVNDDWWVEEADVPAYYDSTVQEVRDNVFYITNTYDEPVIEEPVSSEPESSEPSSEPSEVTPSGPSEEPSSPSSEPSAPSSEPVSEPAESAEPAEPTLPQTGQLWWPVPALFACGAVLVAFGAFKHRRGNGRHER